MSKLDFSKAANDYFNKYLHGNDCGLGKKLNVKLAIEDFSGSDDDGFALSYLL